MPKNTKKPAPKLVKAAAKTMSDKSASKIQRSLAASIVAQSGNSKQTGKKMEAQSSKALKNKNSSKLTKSLAGSLVSQSNKKR